MERLNIGILEDNHALCRVLQLNLEKYGYTVYTSQTVKDFLSFLTSPESADLIIVDFRLLAERSEGGSTLSGVDMIRHSRTIAPEMPALLISAAPLATLQAATIGLFRVKILQKPFEMALLLETIQMMI